MSRLSDAKAIHQRALQRLENPMVDERQKILAGTEVYIRPIYEPSMLHFSGDLITIVEGTYAQMYWGDDFESYSTKISSWYHENQLMPTKGLSLEKCRSGCEEYFGESYEGLIAKKKEATENCPMRKMFMESIDKAIIEAFTEKQTSQPT